MAVIGIRRSGKTTFLRQIWDELLRAGHRVFISGSSATLLSTELASGRRGLSRRPGCWY